MATYFITGATGTVGRALITHLLEQGQQVVAASRHPETSTRLFGNRVKAVFFDFEQPDTFAQALQSDGIFLLGPPLDPQLFALLTPFVDYLMAQDAPRLVYLSANGMEDLEALPFHAQMEDKLRASTLDYYVVRPGFFMQNFGNYERENIEERSVVCVPAGTGKTAFVSTQDIGASVAALLQAKAPEKRPYILTGSQLFDYFEATAVLSGLLGKPLTYLNPDAATYRRILKEALAPDFIADYMIPIYGVLKDGKVAFVSSDVEALTGNAPESLETVLRRDFK